MLLAIDIGNTNIVLGVFEGDVLAARWRLSTQPERMPDEYVVLLRSLLDSADLEADWIHAVIICSVVPAVLSKLCEALRRDRHLEPIVISPQMDIGLEIRYSPPEAVGADRLANALATIECFGAPSIVVDFGTATTVDAISDDRAYVGGAIAPGLEVAQEALFKQTAQLPRIPLEPLNPPGSAIGTTTIGSLQSGALYGYAGLVDGLVERFRAELGGAPRVVATGGLAQAVAPYTKTIQDVEENLTLIGLQLLHRRLDRHANDQGSRKDQSLA